MKTNDLIKYMVRVKTTSGMAWFLCQAESEEHAIEQALNEETNTEALVAFPITIRWCDKSEIVFPVEA